MVLLMKLSHHPLTHTPHTHTHTHRSPFLLYSVGHRLYSLPYSSWPEQLKGNEAILLHEESSFIYSITGISYHYRYNSVHDTTIYTSKVKINGSCVWAMVHSKEVSKETCSYMSRHKYIWRGPVARPAVGAEIVGSPHPVISRHMICCIYIILCITTQLLWLHPV